MRVTVADMKKTLSVEQVMKVLEQHDPAESPGYHTVDFGEAGYHNVECDAEGSLDLAGVLEDLILKAEKNE